MKWMALVLVACLVGACASGPVVESGSDPAADFSRFRSYAWKQEPAIDNPLLRQRVVAAVDAELAERGWRLVPEADADIILVGHVASREDASLDYFHDWRRNGRGDAGLQRIELRTFRVGTLVLDMFDAKSGRAVWRAVAQGPVPESEARRTRQAMRAVHAMFRGFPPPRGSSR